jgi:hypothetical protein
MCSGWHRCVWDTRPWAVCSAGYGISRPCGRRCGDDGRTVDIRFETGRELQFCRVPSVGYGYLWPFSIRTCDCSLARALPLARPEQW